MPATRTPLPPQPVTAKPDVCGVLGHYRTSHRTVLVATQAANSRLFSLQNAHASNLIVVHDIRIEWMQTGTHTAAILDSLDLYRCTGFSVVDTTNTVTPVISKLRTSYGTAGAVVRGVTVAGAAAGMTGATITKDTAPLRQLSQWLLAAQPTASNVFPMEGRYQPSVSDGESPLILAQNEGLIIENRVLLGAAANSAVAIDIAWSEVSSY
jgi:hypothetical protein